MTVADDAIIEAENQVNFNWARTLPSHRAATHTMYALALASSPCWNPNSYDRTISGATYSSLASRTTSHSRKPHPPIRICSRHRMIFLRESWSETFHWLRCQPIENELGPSRGFSYQGTLEKWRKSFLVQGFSTCPNGPDHSRPIFLRAGINTVMETFLEWVKSKKPGPTVPKCDQVLRVVRAAGRNGIDRGSIGSLIALPKPLLDELLAALVGFNQATVTVERDRHVYRA